MLNHFLSFASDVAYYVNILNDEDNNYFNIRFESDTSYTERWFSSNEPCYIMTWYDGYNMRPAECYLPRAVALFIIAGKELPAGLCTPMQRYLAYKALERRNHNA